jgi:hypothetical protein
MTMPTQPDKYTVWNQAVEAVEIYLASNPRELTEEQIIDTCRTITQAYIDEGKVLDPSSDIAQVVVRIALP